MVCDRCKMAVDHTLRNEGLHPTNVDLGEVNIEEDALSKEQRERLRNELEQLGFELLDDKRRNYSAPPQYDAGTYRVNFSQT